MISVIVPVHNGEQHLSRCLDSLMAQTAEQIEFVLIDNGSTDDSLSLMNAYAEKDSRFRVVSQENMGLKGSRNRGLDEAQGNYLGFVDADDFIEPDMFLRLRRALEESAADLAMCDYAMTYTTHETPAVMGYQSCVLDRENVGLDTIYLHYLGPNPVVWNKLYRRELFEREHLRFEINHGEDVLIHLQMISQIRRVAISGFVGYHYVQRKSSLMHTLQQNQDSGFTLLSYYFTHAKSLQGEGRLPYYFFSGMFTGFMFSSHCVGQPFRFFHQQLTLLQKIPFFSQYCHEILTTDSLTPLYKEGAISVRFYLVQKLLCCLCGRGHMGLASFFLWACSKVITVKKRVLLQDLFD